MINLISLNGDYQPQFDTEETVFKPNMINDSMDFARKLRDLEDFSIFYDSILTFLKMVGSSEFDQYRQIICSELLRDITSFKATDKTQQEILNKVVHQMSYEFGLENKQELKQTQTLEKTVSNAPKLTL